MRRLLLITAFLLLCLSCAALADTVTLQEPKRVAEKAAGEQS